MPISPPCPLPCIIGIHGTALTTEESEAIHRFQPAGFVLFSRNIETPEQTRELTDNLRALCRHTPVIAIDQEGGRVVRTAHLGLNLPSARSLRLSGNSAHIAESAAIIAETLKLLGINLDFAPVLDICHDETAANALPGRCWGTNARDVTSHAGMFNANLNHYGIATCGKHFPGMGAASSDPHNTLPVIQLTLSDLLEKELPPFMALLPALPSIMTAHVLFPAIDAELPATLSRRIVTGLLRNQLGYDRIIFTDDLCMGAITEQFGVADAAAMAIDAGCDLPLLCHDPLPWLDRFSSLSAPLINGYREKDYAKRFNKLSGGFSSPAKWKDGSWQRLLDRADDLLKAVPDSPRSGEPGSAVQTY